MAMHNPMHPGELVLLTYLQPFGISTEEFAQKLALPVSVARRFLRGERRVDAELALRLSKGLGCSPESWIKLQSLRDLWLAKQSVDLSKVTKFIFPKEDNIAIEA